MTSESAYLKSHSEPIDLSLTILEEKPRVQELSCQSVKIIDRFSLEACPGQSPNFVEQSMSAKTRKRKRVQDLLSGHDKENTGPEKNKPISKLRVNIVPGDHAEVVQQSPKPEESAKKKRFFKNDPLSLQCEWGECGVVSSSFGEFSRHVSRHCSEVEIRCNPSPLPDSFLCLWKDCGFETTCSKEMVRHVNFHGFHSKVKGHGAAMVEALSLQPCSLPSSQRNLLPDLRQPWACLWPGCSAPHDWSQPQVSYCSLSSHLCLQHFFWHVGEHAASLRGQVPLCCLWPGCSKTDSAVSKLREHLRCHSQEKLVACPTCGGLFASRAKFLDHLRRQERDQQHQCPTCNKGFVTPRLLRDHMRSHVMQYPCPACDMSCTTPSTLANHMVYRHTTERPLACPLCDYRGKTTADLRSHSKVHYTEVATLLLASYGNARLHEGLHLQFYKYNPLCNSSLM